MARRRKIVQENERRGDSKPIRGALPRDVDPYKELARENRESHDRIERTLREAKRIAERSNRGTDLA